MKTITSIFAAMMLVACNGLNTAEAAGEITTHNGPIKKCGSAKRITCIVDGDTIWLDGEKLRLKDFDTPEPTTNICGGEKERKLAAKASARLSDLLNNNAWTVERFGLGKYKRRIVTIRVKDKDVGDILIQERLARSWPDGDEWWCN